MGALFSSPSAGPAAATGPVDIADELECLAETTESTFGALARPAARVSMLAGRLTGRLLTTAALRWRWLGSPALWQPRMQPLARSLFAAA